MLNHITLMGRMTADPTLRHSRSGIPVCTFSIACQRDHKSADGERATDFINIVAWRGIAEFVSKHFTKGRMVVVDGRLQLRDWTDRDGNKRRSAEIVANSVNFGDSRPQNQTAPVSAHSGNSAAQEYGWSDVPGSIEDLPF